MAKAVENQRKESQNMMKQALSGYAKTSDLDDYVKVSDLPVYTESVLLWAGTMHMSDKEAILLSEAVSDQVFGIVLCFSPYQAGVAVDSDFQYFFIPKHHVASHAEKSVSFNDCYKRNC